MKINIEEKLRYTENYIKERTLARLVEISELGLTEVGNDQFGVEGIMSGLYIEMVWSFDDERWKDYVDWIKELLIRKAE